MKTFYPKEHPVSLVHQLLLSGVAPRPIALVGTVDGAGNRNLAPFSFFNAFGANPPVVCVSPSYRGKDGGSKDTFRNIQATGEFTVSAVSWDMIQQVNLASASYSEEIDEFEKAGFTPLPSDLITAPGVAESPFVIECKLMEYVSTGGKPASGNLLIGEVIAFHIRESAYTAGKIDPRRLDLVARMGYEWYCRANGDALFELSKPHGTGIGFDIIPDYIRHSPILTGNDLGRLASVEALPEGEAILKKWKRDLDAIDPNAVEADLFRVELSAGNPRGALFHVLRGIKNGTRTREHLTADLHRCTHGFIADGELDHAWECALLSGGAWLDALLDR